MSNRVMIYLEALIALILLAGPFFCVNNFSHSGYFPVGSSVHPLRQVHFIFPSLICILNVGLVGVIFYGRTGHRNRTQSGLSLLAKLLPDLLIVPLIFLNNFWSPILFSLSQGIVTSLLLIEIQGFRSTTGINKGRKKERPGRDRLALSLVWIFFILLVDWFFSFQLKQLNAMQLGFSDVGFSLFQFQDILRGENILVYFDHFVPASAVLALLYAFYPRVEFFLIAQSVYVAAICVAVFFYSRYILRDSWLALGCFLIAAFMPSISQYSYKFSYGYCLEPMAGALFIFAVMFWEKKRYLIFSLVMLFTCLLKESMIPFFIALSLIEFIFPRQNRPRKIPAILFSVSVVLFILILFVLLPFFAPSGANLHLRDWDHLGKGPLQVLSSPVIRPGQFWPLVINRQTILFIVLIICGAGLAPLFSPRHLAYASIAVLFILMRSDNTIKSICFHYQTSLIAATLCALPNGIKKIINLAETVRKRKLPRLGYPILGGALVLSMLMGHFFGLLPISRPTLPFQKVLPPDYLRESGYIRTLAQGIPRNWKVLSTYRAALHFSGQDELRIVGGDYPRKSKPSQPESEYLPEIIVLDLANTWGQTKDEIQEVINRYFNREHYLPLRTERYYLLLVKGNFIADRLRTISPEISTGLPEQVEFRKRIK